MPPRSPNPRWLTLAFLAAVFLVKLTVVLDLKDHPLTQPDVGLDTTAYAVLANQVLNGDIWLGTEAYFVSPLYIYALAGGLALTDSFAAVRVLQIGLGTLAAWFVVLMAREWFSRRAGWMAGAFAALTGLFTFYESLILQASLDAFLTAAALLSLTLGLKRNRLTWFLAAGVFLGIATLNRPNMLAAALGVAAVAFATRRLKPAGAVLMGVAIGIAPVTARNVLVSEDSPLVSSHGGLNFYIGNGEGATGFYRPVPGITPTIAGQARDTRAVAAQALGRNVTTEEASDYFYDLAWQHIRAQPAEAIALFAMKLGYVFHAQHIALPYSYPFYAHEEKTALRYLVAGPWLIIPLGLFGLAAPVLRRQRLAPIQDQTAYLVWLSFVPAYACSVALFFVAERYRLPVLIPLLVGAGAAADALWRAVAERRTKKDVVVPAAFLAVMFALVNSRQPLHDGRWDEGVRMAERLVILGRYDEADARMKRIERDEPERGAARYAVARQLLALKQYDRAAELARTIAPGDNAPAEAWLRVGRLAAQARAPQIADAFFVKGAALAPNDAGAREQYGLNLVLIGRLDSAAVELTEAVRLNPGAVESLAHLAYCEARLGRLDEARRHADAALALQPNHDLARRVRAALR